MRFDVTDPIGESKPTEQGGVVLLFRKLLVEFIGDLLFVFIGTLCILSEDLVAVGLAHGFTIAILVASFGHISGGHFNPAVTLGIMITGEMNPFVGIAYWANQLGGGFAGAFLARACIHKKIYFGIKLNCGMTAVNTEVGNWDEALIIEIIMTFFLVTTVLHVAVDTDKNVLAPLAIGLTVAVDIFAGGSVDGASMNPARTFGPAVVCSIAGSYTDDGKPVPARKLSEIWKYQYIYYVGPAIGASIAALIYKLFTGKREKRWIWK